MFCPASFDEINALSIHLQKGILHKNHVTFKKDSLGMIKTVGKSQFDLRI